jgi:hypothetical protein
MNYALLKERRASLHSPRIGRALLCTPLESASNGAHGVTRPTCAVRLRGKGKPLFLDFSVDETGGISARHLAANPATVGVEILFVPPKHFQLLS